MGRLDKIRICTNQKAWPKLFFFFHDEVELETGEEDKAIFRSTQAIVNRPASWGADFFYYYFFLYSTLAGNKEFVFHWPRADSTLLKPPQVIWLPLPVYYSACWYNFIVSVFLSTENIGHGLSCFSFGEYWGRNERKPTKENQTNDWLTEWMNKTRKEKYFSFIFFKARQ